MTYEFIISKETPFNYMTATSDPDPMYRYQPCKGVQTEKAGFSMDFPEGEIDWDAVIEEASNKYPQYVPKDMPMVEIDGSRHLRSAEKVPQKLGNGSWGQAYVYLYEANGRV